MILVLLPESHITMKLRLFLLASLCWNLSVGQTTFYSRNATSGGNWNDVNSWTLNSDGSGGPVVTVPARTDNIVVLTGHTITVTTADSNGSTGTSANAVYGSTGFTGSGTARFYQNGDITISTGGTLSVTDANGAMFEGNENTGSIDTTEMEKSIELLSIALEKLRKDLERLNNIK